MLDDYDDEELEPSLEPVDPNKPAELSKEPPDWSPDLSPLTPTQALVAKALIQYSREHQVLSERRSRHVSIYDFIRAVRGEEMHYHNLRYATERKLLKAKNIDPETAAHSDLSDEESNIAWQAGQIVHEELVARYGARLGHMSEPQMRRHLRGIQGRQNRADPVIEVKNRMWSGIDLMWPDVLARDAQMAELRKRDHAWIDRIEDLTIPERIMFSVSELHHPERHIQLGVDLRLKPDREAAQVVADWLEQSLQKFSSLLLAPKPEPAPVEPEPDDLAEDQLDGVVPVEDIL